MQPIQQMVPISELRYKHVEVIEKLDNGPVILAQRGTPKAVMVLVNDWDKAANEIARLRRIIYGDRILAELEADPSLEVPFTWAELKARGVIDG